MGLRFRRQHPIGPYFADFVCLELRLVVELDGGQHADPCGLERDRVRTAALEERGYEVIRFWDNDVLRDTQAVLAAIARRARRWQCGVFVDQGKRDQPSPQPSPAKREREQAPHPSPLPLRGRGCPKGG
jgi:hypothetical protein